MRMETLITEIRESLNNRRLTYIEEEPDDMVIIRPIDLLQSDMILTYPFETMQEFKQAVPSSHKLIEEYRTI
ncbi:hypothetical protein KIN20_031651 [Parelaphostrongylus tenuis]|uniref:Uncharacterized protein n=1 Tax=Parelaphostrongylus tenuis TaxID=148309 RepID=A0AAD5R5E4_PARTN|nr:hypothetical protein KIN20_031651 [Parelaphostrongylus tenuis]